MQRSEAAAAAFCLPLTFTGCIRKNCISRKHPHTAAGELLKTAQFNAIRALLVHMRKGRALPGTRDSNGRVFYTFFFN